MSADSLKPLHEYQLIDLIREWYQNRKKILLGTMIGLILSMIVSFIVPVYYQSKTILYPISMTMADRNIIFGQQQGQAEFSYFGNKYDASRILQVANSAEVIDYIIQKYELAKHYQYAMDEKYLKTKVKEDFLDNYHALKNDKDAIEITLLDTDKDKCAQMTNDIATKIDEVATRPVIESKAKIIKMLELELAKKTKQSEELNSTILVGNQKTETALNLNSEIKQLSEALTQYSVSANDKFSSVTILEKAAPAEKKTKPVRWIIVAASTILSFVLCLLLSLFSSQFQYVKKQI